MTTNMDPEHGEIVEMSPAMNAEAARIATLHTAWIMSLVGTDIDVNKILSILAFDIGARLGTLLDKSPGLREKALRVVHNNIECGMQHEAKKRAEAAGAANVQTDQD